MAENKKIEVAIVGGSRGSGKTFKQQMGILEELQAYRALGTVEEIKSIKNGAKFVTDILAEYSSIGTIEAFKALKEKSEPKKPLILDRRCENGDEVCIEWKCPVCGLNVIEEPPCQEYCQRCGNKLNWDWQK